MKKEFVINKNCDQKDKEFREYQFIRELEIDENGIPLDEELENIINNEDENRMVAFFIAKTHIKMFSYKNLRKFRHKVIEEYNNSYNEETYNKFYLASDEKMAEFISSEINYIKTHNKERVRK